MRRNNEQAVAWEALEPRLMMSGAPGAELPGESQHVDLEPIGTVTVAGEVLSEEAGDVYSFVAPARGRIIIETSGFDGLDSFLELYNAKGRRIRKNNDLSKVSLDSRIRLAAKPGRLYYVKVSGAAGTTGAYDLSLTSEPKDDCGNTLDTAKTWRIGRKGGGRKGGCVNYNSDVDLLQVVATKTGVMQVSMNPIGRNNQLECDLAVTDASGMLLASADAPTSSAAVLSLSVTAGETYYLQAAGGADSVGRYRINVKTAKPAPQPDPAPAPDPDPDPAPDPDPDPAPDPTPDPLPGETIIAEVQSTASGLSLLVLGTDLADTITLSQTAAALTLTTGLQVDVFDGSFTSVVVYGFGGDDVIRMTADVTAAIWIDAGAGNDTLYEAGAVSDLRGGAGDDLLISLGGGADAVAGGEGLDSYWTDADDRISDVSAAEVSGAAVHRISEFYQPYTSDSDSAQYVSMTIAGQDLADPITTAYASGYASFAASPLFVNTPQYSDIDQGGLGDCYYLACLAGYAQTDANIIKQMITPLGDGTYAVRFYRGGREVYLRIDADLPVRYGRLVYAGLGDEGETWVALAEKAYAYFRYGQNSYDSIQGGWMNTVYNEITNSSTQLKWTSGMSATAIYNYVTDQIASGSTVSLGSCSGGDGPVVGGHAYAVLSAEEVGGQKYITVYNPWGIDGRTYDSNSSDGVLRLTIDQVKSAYIALAVSFA